MPTQTFFNLPEDKRNQIVEAAIETFYEKGYEKMSIASVIEKADIPRGSFYQYFSGKKDLYKFLIIDVIGRKKHSYLNPFHANIEEMPFIDILQQLFLNGISFYRQEPVLASIATEFLNLRDQNLKSEIQGDSQRISNNFFKKLIEERKASNEISPKIDTEMLIYLINTVNTSFAQYFIEHEEMNFEDDELITALDNMLFILKNGLLAN